MGISSTTVNVVPFPCSLWQSMEPPIRSTICFVMARPRPVPWMLFTRLSVWRENGWYMFAMNSGVIPMPVSDTL